MRFVVKLTKLHRKKIVTTAQGMLSQRASRMHIFMAGAAQNNPVIKAQTLIPMEHSQPLPSMH